MEALLAESGLTIDFFAWNASNQVWNGSAFVTWSAGSYASYRIAADEVESSGRYIATTPTGTTSYELRERGASLALSPVRWADIATNETVAYGSTGTNHDYNFYNDDDEVWNGSAFVAWANADYVSYRIAATELSGSGRFYPSTTAPALTTSYELRERGASLALSPRVFIGEYAFSTAGTRTGYLVCYDEQGVVQQGVDVTMRCYYSPSTGLSLDADARIESSNAVGYVEFTNLVIGAKYKISRGDFQDFRFTVADGVDPFEIVSIVGKD